MMHAHSPAELGYRMPAEWEPHHATWLAWPHNHETWPQRLVEVQNIYLQMMAALMPHEQVHLLINDEGMAKHVAQQLVDHHLNADQLKPHLCPTVDAWLRDSGPTFLTPADHHNTLTPALIDWQFNAWGNKYPEMLSDNHVPQHLAEMLQFHRFEPSMVLEGGAIDVNGLGSCLTTEQCLLNPNRNPGLTRSDIERYLSHFLAVRHVIWLGEGIAGDDTDGHVDDIARFVNPRTVVCALTDDPDDINYTALQDNYRRLQVSTDQNGRPLQVIALPMPGPLWADDDPLPASYANFYVANGVVLVPTYQHPNDRLALDILQGVFPRRRVAGIPCEPLVWGLGAIHCVTQQQPAQSSIA
jgi:agmatine deiminase